MQEGKQNKDWVKWKEALNLPIKEIDFLRWQSIDGDDQKHGIWSEFYTIAL